MERIYFGMGCFWGVERKLWQQPGVVTTAVGYAGGHTENPTYSQVCDGATGHAEIVNVEYDASVVSTADLLKLFWESHDPTQGDRQGNDRGTQYRSAIYCTTQDQYDQAIATRDAFQPELTANGFGPITTEIVFPAPAFYPAEEYHQRYLEKNPNGYCGLRGTGVTAQT